jgi:hypothetical protein
MCGAIFFDSYQQFESATRQFSQLKQPHVTPVESAKMLSFIELKFAHG